jgi:hypothetical protein
MDVLPDATKCSSFLLWQSSVYLSNYCCVTKLLGNRSRWRKISVLSSGPGEKISAKPTAPTVSITSVPEPKSSPDTDTRTPHRTELSHRHSWRVSGRAQPHHRATELTNSQQSIIPIPIRLQAPAPTRLSSTLPNPTPIPDFRPVRSPSERKPGLPDHPLLPARSFP